MLVAKLTKRLKMSFSTSKKEAKKWLKFKKKKLREENVSNAVMKRWERNHFTAKKGNCWDNNSSLDGKIEILN